MNKMVVPFSKVHSRLKYPGPVQSGHAGESSGNGCYNDPVGIAVQQLNQRRRAQFGLV